MASEAAVLPEDVIKLQVAVNRLQAVVRSMKHRQKEYRALGAAADCIQSAVATSCTRKAILELPLFAQPVVDIATRALAQCAADMEETETNGVRLFRRFKLKSMREDCARAVEAFHCILQIEDGRSLLIESDGIGDIKFPRPPAWEDDNSELGGQISTWNTIWDGLKVLLAGTVNATDGAVIPMGPEPIKAVVQTVVQALKHVEDYHASKDSIEQLQTTIELYWDVVSENYVPSASLSGVRNALDMRVQRFLRLLQRTVIRLYLLRTTSWLKRFIAVSTANALLDTEKRALEDAKNGITLALGFSTHAGVRGNRLEILRGHSKVEGVGELVRGVAGMFQKARDHDKLERWLAVGRNVDDRQRELQAVVAARPDWFFNDAFDEWKNAEKGSTGSLYWISADPGSGKSVLLSAVVQRLPPEDRVFFHFDMRNGQPTLRDFLAAVVSQLGHRLGGYPPALLSACEKGYEQTASEEILRDAATEMLTGSSAPRILAIDALDECPKLLERWKAVQSLLDALRGTGARIIVTSRRGNFQLVQYMTKHAGHRLHLNDSAHHHVLLREYIDLRLADFLWPAERKVKVASILNEKAEGMFLWVSLHLDRLQFASPQLVEDMLHEIPESLDDTYRTIIESFSSSTAVINSVSHVLQCLALSYESLSPRQVAELLVAFEFPRLDGLPRTNPPYQRLILPVVSHYDSDIPEPEAFVLSRLPALLRITEDKGEKVVRFLHVSIVEYLQSAVSQAQSLVQLYAFNPGIAHMTWLRVCLTVLENRLSLDLTAYARRAWVHHVSSLLDANEDILEDLLSPAPAALKDLFGFGADGDFSCFALACEGGHLSFAAWFLANGADVNGADLTCTGPRIFWKNSPLLVAACYGHTDIVELLIRHSADLAVASAEGWTALLFAAYYGHSELCSLLLDKGSDIAHRTTQGASSLHLAAHTGSLEAARVLIERGAQVDAVDEDSLTPLFFAVSSGYMDVAELLIRHGASLAVTTKDGGTVLHLAASNGNADLCSFLIDQGSDVGHRTKRGSSALHLAAKNGHVEAARVLIEKGAQVDAAGYDLWRPLDLATWNNHRGVVDLLIQHGASLTVATKDGWTALLLAASYGDCDLCSLLLDKGADIADTTGLGSSALHLATQRGDLDVVRVLIDHGARVDAETHDLVTPLHAAALNGHTEIAKLLLHHGASLTAADTSGYTALLRSAVNGQADLCALLLDKGADIRHSIEGGASALHLAARKGHIEVARVLIEYGAQVDAVDDELSTPLHRAAQQGHAEMAKLLLQHGASVALANEVGWTALLWAADAGQSDLCALLLDRGSDVLHSTPEGHTALHLAAYKGHLAVARVLLDRQALVTARDIDGGTPRDFARQAGHDELAAFLLSWEQRTAGIADGVGPADKAGVKDVAVAD